MNDQELLEKAAQAYWRQEIADEEVSLRYDEREEAILYFHADNQDHNGCDREFRWNPLIEDGDALPLAVKLNFGVKVNGPTDWQNPNCTIVLFDGPVCGHRLMQQHNGESAVATRRAIVRAAAEMATEK